MLAGVRRAVALGGMWLVTGCTLGLGGLETPGDDASAPTTTGPDDADLDQASPGDDASPPRIPLATLAVPATRTTTPGRPTPRRWGPHRRTRARAPRARASSSRADGRSLPLRPPRRPRVPPGSTRPPPRIRRRPADERRVQLRGLQHDGAAHVHVGLDCRRLRQGLLRYLRPGRDAVAPRATRPPEPAGPTSTREATRPSTCSTRRPRPAAERARLPECRRAAP